MKRTVLDELGNPDAKPGTHDWTIAVRRDVSCQFREAETQVGIIQMLLKSLRKHQAWKSVTQPDGTTFGSFEHFCETPFGEGGLGIDPDVVIKIIEEKDRSRFVSDVKAEMAETARQEAHIRPGPGRPKEQENHSNGKVSGGGNNQPYLLRRLARIDEKAGSDWVSQWERGAFPSVRQAAIAAGIVKVPTPLDVAKKAIEKLSDEAFNEFLLWLKTKKRT